MVKDRGSTIQNPTDREFVQMKLKQIKEAKKAGNEVQAQRLADELFIWLGWE